MGVARTASFMLLCSHAFTAPEPYAFEIAGRAEPVAVAVAVAVAGVAESAPRLLSASAHAAQFSLRVLLLRVSVVVVVVVVAVAVAAALSSAADQYQAGTNQPRNQSMDRINTTSNRVVSSLQRQELHTAQPRRHTIAHTPIRSKHYAHTSIWSCIGCGRRIGPLCR